MNSEIVTIFVNIGNIVLVFGLYSSVGVIGYYMVKTAIEKNLTQGEFTRAVVLIAITSFIVGVGGIPISLATIDNSTPLVLRWFLSILTCGCCLVIWPLLMVVVFVREYKRNKLIHRDE